jgi:Uma2 family endonuclease
VLVTPAPGTRHQVVAARLFSTLDQHVQRHQLGYVLWDVDLLFIEGQFLRPDFVWVPASSRVAITDRGVEAVPGLVVEVLSPSSRAIDLVKKPRRYADFGVPEYWVADPVDQVIHRFDFTTGHHDPQRIERVLVWQPPGAMHPLEIDLASVFAELWSARGPRNCNEPQQQDAEVYWGIIRHSPVRTNRFDPKRTASVPLKSATRRNPPVSLPVRPASPALHCPRETHRRKSDRGDPRVRAH